MHFNLKKGKSFASHIILTLLIFLFEHAAYAQYPKVEIENSELRKISTSVIKQDLLLYVHLPGSYKKTNQKYPVLYLLDGHWLFPMVTGLYGNELGDAAIPEMIIVGITWDGKNLNYDSLRQSNYTPSNSKDIPGSGNAANFLASLK